MSKTKKLYKGVIVPMVTPLNNDYSIDQQGVGRLVQLIVNTGCSPFIAGTTGEASSLSLQQKEILLKETLAQVAGKTLVYAGISANCLSESVEAAKRFADLGADVLVANLPSYYPLTNETMLRYCEALADASPKPLFFYNIPATTGFSIPLTVLETLSYHPNIAGLKDSERDQNRLDEALYLWRDREDFSHLTGWAAMSAYALKNGSDGIVPSTGNFVPALYQELYLAALNSEWEQTEILQQQANDLSALYQKGRNLSESLAALKVILSVKGICGTQMMPPVYPMNDSDEEKYRLEIAQELN